MQSSLISPVIGKRAKLFAYPVSRDSNLFTGRFLRSV